MNFSYWEQKQWFSQFDVAIIGSGIVGLNAAIHLKKLDAKLRVVILEKGFLPTGASTKNAGFACFGSPSEMLDDLTSHSEQEVVGMISDRFLGLEQLKSTVGAQRMNYQQLGSLELFDATQSDLYNSCIRNLGYLNRLIEDATGLDQAFVQDDKAIDTNGLFGFNSAIKHRFEAQIDTGKMMQNLLQQVSSLGVAIYNGFGVESFVEVDNGLEIVERSGAKVFATKMIVATNGFAKQMLPKLDVVPARAQVLITKPIKGLKLKGTFHMDEGFYYFRNIDNRVLFGGGRNLDFDGEKSYDFEGNSIIQERLRQILFEKIVPYQKVEIEQYWSGIMGVGKKKKAIVQQLSAATFVAVRMGGMGIAIGSKIGKNVAELCYEN